MAQKNNIPVFSTWDDFRKSFYYGVLVASSSCSRHGDPPKNKKGFGEHAMPPPLIFDHVFNVFTNTTKVE